MRSKTNRFTMGYYILIALFLAFLFFSNDFGLIDVQKTAIVTAAGIDREGEEFVLTSQIAIPQSSQQGKSTQAVQLVSRGKTISEAFEQINVKTGWYPKLVFCKLLLFGEKAAEENVFDALDFFLLDEYLTDDCQVAVCEGLAKDMLDVSALVDPTSSLAIEKVLSAHAERVGTVRPITLKDFAIGYFGETHSGLLPLLKKEKQQEETSSSDSSSLDSSSEESSSAKTSSSGGQGSDESQNSENKEKEKPVFSAQQTALFVGGRKRGVLSPEETFAVNAATGKLRLASYSVDYGDETCTLTIKHNSPKIKLSVGKEGNGQIKISLVMTAGITDYSKALDIKKLADAGNVPDGIFAAAEKKLTAELTSAYEKARSVGCDVFEIKERLIKYKNRKYHTHADGILDKTSLSVNVRFEKVR